MAVATFWIAQSDALSVSTALWIAFWVYCLASATQDIAIDAYSIGITPRGEEGPVNSMKAIAYRCGMLARIRDALFAALDRVVGHVPRRGV